MVSPPAPGAAPPTQEEARTLLSAIYAGLHALGAANPTFSLTPQASVQLRSFHDELGVRMRAEAQEARRCMSIGCWEACGLTVCSGICASHDACAADMPSAPRITA